MDNPILIEKIKKQRGKIFFAVLVIASYAAYCEYTAASDVTKRANEDLEIAKKESTSTCDRLQLIQELNKYTSSKVVVQWRRGILVATGTLLLTALIKGNIDSKKAFLVGLLITWVCTVSIQGFMDYHLREVSTTVIDQIVSLTKNGLSNSSCTSKPFRSNDLHGRTLKEYF